MGCVGCVVLSVQQKCGERGVVGRAGEGGQWSNWPGLAWHGLGWAGAPWRAGGRAGEASEGRRRAGQRTAGFKQSTPSLQLHGLSHFACLCLHLLDACGACDWYPVLAPAATEIYAHRHNVGAYFNLSSDRPLEW